MQGQLSEDLCNTVYRCYDTAERLTKDGAVELALQYFRKGRTLARHLISNLS